MWLLIPSNWNARHDPSSTAHLRPSPACGQGSSRLGAFPQRQWRDLRPLPQHRLESDFRCRGYERDHCRTGLVRGGTHEHASRQQRACSQSSEPTLALLLAGHDEVRLLPGRLSERFERFWMNPTQHPPHRTRTKWLAATQSLRLGFVVRRGTLTPPRRAQPQASSGR